MDKIVCEVCGAAYPETASRCPVCGSVRYSTPEPISDVVVPERENKRPEAGRNAKANVKKRRKRNKRNAQLVQYIAIGSALVLLLVLLLTLVLSSCNNEAGNDPTVPSTEATNPPTQAPTGISCIGITLNLPEHTFTAEGDQLQLTATCEPEDTTDFLTFASNNPSVVTVDEDGTLVAVAPGTATITVFCGRARAFCVVTCDWQDATEEPTLPPETLKLNRADFSLFYKGATWQLYDGVIDVNLITFTSDNDAIATFVAGKVTAVGRGTTTVHAEFGGQKVSCIVRCSFRDDTTSGGNGGVQEDNGTTGSSTAGVFSQWGAVPKNADGNGDISIKVGDKVQLFLRDSSGTKVVVDWTVSTEGYISISGSEITGTAKGVVVLKTTHNGTEYKCYIRVI